MNLQNKTALVTGGSSGLGLAIAQKLLSKGVKVVICGRTEKTLLKAQQTLNSDKLTTFVCDVSDYSQVEAMVKKIGPVDILINNAGIWLEGELDMYSPSQIKKVIDINLTGTIFVTRAVLPQMKQVNQGFIINVSSTSGLKGRDDQAVYTASKFGVRGFTDSLKIDLHSSSNIRVAGFYPGGMNTPLFNKAGNPKDNQDWMDPQEVADIIVFILENDKAMVIDHLVVNKRGTKTSNK